MCICSVYVLVVDVASWEERISGSPIFAVRFRNGAPASFPRTSATRIFNRGAIDSDVESEIIVWADGEAEIDLGPGDRIESLYCARFTSWAFLERLFELAKEVGFVVLFLPHCSVTDADLIHHLPASLAKFEPQVVTSAKEMIEAMEIIWVNPGEHDRIA